MPRKSKLATEPKAKRTRTGLTAASLALLDQVIEKRYTYTTMWGEVVKATREKALIMLCEQALALPVAEAQAALILAAKKARQWVCAFCSETLASDGTVKHKPGCVASLPATAPELAPPGPSASEQTSDTRGMVKCPGCGRGHISGHRESCACDHCEPLPEKSQGRSREGQAGGELPPGAKEPGSEAPKAPEPSTAAPRARVWAGKVDLSTAKPPLTSRPLLTGNLPAPSAGSP